jgi:hypothetical protein
LHYNSRMQGTMAMKGLGPAHCGGFWSPIMAAGPESTLSGVLAGFVFTAITVILTTSSARPARPARPDKAGEGRSYALQMLASAFIIFALDSYLGSVIAGELACSRAYAQIALLGGILGDGAILTIAGLGWLIVAYSVPAKGIDTVLSYINWGVWAIVVFMLTTSAMGIGEAMLPGRSHAVVNSVPWVLGIALAAAVFVRARNHRELGKSGGEALSTGSRIQKSVSYAALSGLAAAIFGVLFTGIARMFGDTWWITPSSAAIYVVVVLSVLVPAFPLWASIRPAMAARAALAGMAETERAADGRAVSQDGVPGTTDGGAGGGSDVDRDGGENSATHRSVELGDEPGGAVASAG